MAQAGHAMNQTSCAGSPHPHVRVAEGCPDQTCHHRTTAGTAEAGRWRRRGSRRCARPGRCGCEPRAARRAGARRLGRRLGIVVATGPAGTVSPGGWDGRRECSRHVHPTRHCRRAYRRAPRRPGTAGAPSGRVPMIVAVPDRPPLRRRRRRAPRPLRGVGAGAAGLARGRARGGRRGRATSGRAPRATPASSVSATPSPSTSRWPCGPGTSGRTSRRRRRATAAPRHRPGDLRRRGRARRHRRRAGGRRAHPSSGCRPRTRRGVAGGIATAGPVLFEPDVRRPGRGRLPARARARRAASSSGPASP